MAEMYHVGDKDKNEKLELQEFIRGMLDHPVTSKILRIKKIGKLEMKGHHLIRKVRHIAVLIF
jgi:hypothetical protein